MSDFWKGVFVGAALGGNSGNDEGAGCGSFIVIVVAFVAAAAIFGGHDKKTSVAVPQAQPSATSTQPPTASTMNAVKTGPGLLPATATIGELFVAGWFGETDRPINFYPLTDVDQDAPSRVSKQNQAPDIAPTSIRIPVGTRIDASPCDLTFCGVGVHGLDDKVTWGIANSQTLEEIHKNALYDFHASDSEDTEIRKRVVLPTASNFYPRIDPPAGTMGAGTQSLTPIVIAAGQQVDVARCNQQGVICVVRTKQPSGDIAVGLMYKNKLPLDQGTLIPAAEDPDPPYRPTSSDTTASSVPFSGANSLSSASGPAG